MKVLSVNNSISVYSLHKAIVWLDI